MKLVNKFLTSLNPLHFFLHKTDFEIKVDEALNRVGTQSALIAGFSFTIMMQKLNSISSINIFTIAYLLSSAITIVLELFVTFGSGILAISVKPKNNPNSIPQSTISQIWWAYMIGIFTFLASVFFVTFDKLHSYGYQGKIISFLILIMGIVAIIFARNIMRTINEYQKSSQ